MNEIDRQSDTHISPPPDVAVRTKGVDGYMLQLPETRQWCIRSDFQTLDNRFFASLAEATDYALQHGVTINGVKFR